MSNAFKNLAKSLLAVALFVNAGTLEAQTPSREERPSIQFDARTLDAYAGQYRYETIPDRVLTVSREGNRLFVDIPRNSKAELFAEAESKFFLKTSPVQLIFGRDEEGYVAHVEVVSNGETLRAKRLVKQAAWKPLPGATQVRIWPGVIPDARPIDGPEVAGTVVDPVGNKKLVGGKPWIYVDRVSQPTMTVYPPRGNNTGVAVVVFPGGGYNVLAIDLEGTEACDWLTSKGITCVLLKYRVPCVKVGPYRDCPTALQDAQRTVGLLRFQAAQWKIDPRKIGVLGFSAGGHMVAAISTHFEKRLYPVVDDADKESCRPDFAVALYPGHLAVREKDFALNPDLQVTSQTPPTFLLHAEDDRVDPVEHSLVYYSALRKAGVSAEMHVYPKGGHAFGLRPTESAITGWPQLVETWLRTIGMTSR